ncbi:hypothetical protein D9M68_297140 [compost metagenome]|uniref:hypothetical protein n=1 Tax=Pseudomonas jinjuensis TaxID=198616 RepID=UPI000A000B8E|nr:hypothetical protein [Pseudomonas jinjuensis]
MNKDPNKVVQLPSRTPHGALERLNRITGAQFSRWPDWLLPESQSKANSEPVVDSPELQVG